MNDQLVKNQDDSLWREAMYGRAVIESLEQEVFAAGFNWGWEGRPPDGGLDRRQMDAFRPLCVGCEKIHSEERLGQQEKDRG